MNETLELNRGRALVQRWCVLSEQRLEYLTELFETGRWRRYFDEVAFLENIQEAKRAVSVWRALLECEASSDNRPVDLSWLGRRPQRQASQPRLAPESDRAAEPQPSLVATPQATLVPALQPIDPIRLPAAAAVIALPPPPQPIAEPADPMEWTRALDPEILQQRYPILRNAL